MEPINWYALDVVVAFAAVMLTVWGIRQADKARIDARIREIEKNLSDFKTEASQRFATNQAIREIESRVISAITKIGDRIDRMLETISHNQTPRI